jgi:hypothetical protein
MHPYEVWGEAWWDLPLPVAAQSWVERQRVWSYRARVSA